MSKSKGNVVSPDDMVAQFGADSTRVYSLFATSPDRELDWQEAGVEGPFRFLSRTYRFVMRHAKVARERRSGVATGELSTSARRIQRKLHQTIKRVTDDFQGRWHFNTSVAAIMEFVNELYTAEEEIAAGRFSAGFLGDAQRKLVLLLQPFAPYLAAELWEALGEKSNLLRQPWPEYDHVLAKEEQIIYPVQVNGKLRGHISVPAESEKEFVLDRALNDEKVRSAIASKQVVKTIFVPGKLVNIVVR
jgi:leucyl-tRNA synthetase